MNSGHLFKMPLKAVIRTSILVCLMVIVSIGCKKPAVHLTQDTSSTSSITFSILDSIEASSAIIKDKSEKYFDKVQSLEMSIIMKKEDISDASRSELLEGYKTALQEEVEDFSASDKVTIDSLQNRIGKLLKNLSKGLVVPQIKLIKLKTKLYGPGVFFTRDECIAIPKDELEAGNLASLEHVFLHEIYHILSRYNPEYKKESYALIGYKKLEKELVVPDQLRERLLYNPDGIDMGFAINLYNDSGENLDAVSIIYANSPIYGPDKPSYFSYLQFDLFRVVEDEGKFTVMLGDPLGPEIPDLFYPSFFEQIKDNTQYIIHPDEILADNFIFASLDNAGQLEADFSPEGIELIKDLQSISFNEDQ